ncbi:MAG: hypothetical protein ACRECF_03690 [Methyloceanibacter sp.]
MTETEQHPAVSVSFKNSNRLYDYLIPEGATVMAGDTVIVETRGCELPVTVITVKSHSDSATKPFLRRVEEEKDEADTDGA